MRVALPPLRERPDDIPLLVDHFVRELGRGAASLPERTVRALESQAFPGNVRELRNAVARALSLGGGSGRPSAPPPGAPAPAAIDLSVPLVAARDRVTEAFEEAYLREALRETGGNVSRAAEIAGVNRKFIQRAMKRYGLRGGDD